MKLSNFQEIGRLVSERNMLAHQLDGLADADLTVQVRSRSRSQGGMFWGEHTYTDRIMADAMRPAIEAELERRLAVNTSGLTALGVLVDVLSASTDIDPRVVGSAALGTVSRA